MITHSDWATHLKKCLDSTQFMALATRGADGLWNHAVFFAYDEQLNLYFISEPSSRHMQNIAANGDAAVAIFSTDQSPTDDVAGIQIRARAEILPDNEIEQAHAIYYARSPIIPGIPAEITAYKGEAATWKFVKLTPLEIGYFDTRLAPDRQSVPEGVKP